MPSLRHIVTHCFSAQMNTGQCIFCLVQLHHLESSQGLSLWEKKNDLQIEILWLTKEASSTCYQLLGLHRKVTTHHWTWYLPYELTGGRQIPGLRFCSESVVRFLTSSWLWPGTIFRFFLLRQNTITYIEGNPHNLDTSVIYICGYVYM